MKKGFTLMELMVYMAIVGIIVVVAGQAFSNSTKFRVRTQNMLKATQEAENVASLFKADVSQMGAKSAKEETGATGAEDTFEKYTSCTAGQVDCIYMNPNAADAADQDYSSYKIESAGGGNYDKLTIRRLRYDNQGHYQAIEQVVWDVTDKTLKRSCSILRQKDSYTLPDDDPCKEGAGAVDMATGVEKFKVYPGIPTIRSDAAAAVHQEETIFPPGGAEAFSLLPRPTAGDYVAPTSVTAGGSSVTITGFASNYNTASGQIVVDGKNVTELYVATNEDHGADPSWADYCYKVSLEKGIEYEISFSMVHVSVADGMQLFVAGRDHMAVGFRNTDGTKPASTEDFLFYPPTNEDSQGARTMRFSVPANLEEVCMAFTFSTYSPVASTGSITISKLKLRQVAGSNYVFDKSMSISTVDKKHVKALMLELQIGRGGKNGHEGETGEATIVIPTPSNGIGD